VTSNRLAQLQPKVSPPPLQYPENWTLFKEVLMIFMASNVEILILSKVMKMKEKKFANDVSSIVKIDPSKISFGFPL
jgi:hypothetical protein